MYDQDIVDGVIVEAGQALGYIPALSDKRTASSDGTVCLVMGASISNSISSCNSVYCRGQVWQYGNTEQNRTCVST